MKKIKLFILTLFLLTKMLSAQTVIKGVVNNELNEAIAFVNITIRDSANTIIAYAFSSKTGSYLLQTNQIGRFILEFSSLTYQNKSFPFEAEENKEIIKNVILKEEAYSLEEVMIKADRTISIKKDTITFKASRFLQGDEVVVEDLLRKIPGISVTSEGTIKIGNQEIERLMIDGDDFFDKGYKILSKNMPPDEIDKIELLQKYANNKLLKNIEQSDKVALNLVLKKDAKRKWFGNFSLAYDLTFNNRYSIKSYLMNFGKKTKYVFLSNINNIAYDATGDINHLVKPFRYGELASIGDNQNVNTLLNVNSFTPNFKTSRTNFNNSELASLNAIFTLSENVKLKTLGFFNWDEKDFFRNVIQTFISNQTDFTNTENLHLRNKIFVGFGKIDLFYDISKTRTFEAVTKYNNQTNNNKSNLVFNNVHTLEDLKSRNILFDQKITYTNSFKKNKVFLLTGRHISEKLPEHYSTNQFYFQDLFPNLLHANNVAQLVENRMEFVGIEGHLLDRKVNGNLLELKLGNQYRTDHLISSFLLKENNRIIKSPVGYQNNLIYSVNDSYFKTKYRLKIKDVGFTGNLDSHQLFNSKENTNQHPFYINPQLKIDWEIDQTNKINLSYAFTTRNAKITDIYNNYILSGFRNFNKGTNTFDQLTASSIKFKYQLGNWSDKLFANVSIVYSKNFDFYSSNSIITQNYSQLEKTLIKDRNSFAIFSELNRYFKTISSNLKLELIYVKSNYKNQINQSGLRKVKSTNYSMGFELRSAFQSMFNYHFGSKWIGTQIASTINNSYTNNVSFLNLSFYFNKKFDIQVETERYLFNNINTRSNIYYFADLEMRYKLKKNKLNLSLLAKNLFNTNTFTTFSISDISISTTSYRLLPRYILFKVVYRF